MTALPLLYLDTSAWNAVKHPGGTEALREIFCTWRAVVSNGVLMEVRADPDFASRAAILDFMADVGSVRLLDDGFGVERTFALDNTDVRQVQVPPRWQSAMDRLVIKFFGGRADESFEDLVQALGQEMVAMSTAHLPPHLAELMASKVQAAMPQIAKQLSKACGQGIGFNGRDQFQDVFDLDSVRTNAHHIRPPRIIDQLWTAVRPRPEEHLNNSINQDQFFGCEGHQGLPGEFVATAFEKAIAMYSTLNFYGYAADRQLSKDDRIESALRDGRHVALATAVDGLLTCDERMHKKAYAIYEYLDPGTRSIWLRKEPHGCRMIEAW
jgi:hypothetical protein